MKKQFILVIIALLSIPCIAQLDASFGEKQFKEFAKEMEKREKSWEMTSKMAMSPQNKTVAGLYINGQKAAVFRDMTSCKFEIGHLRVQAERLWDKLYSEYKKSGGKTSPADDKDKRAFLSKIDKNCSCQTEDNPNYGSNNYNYSEYYDYNSNNQMNNQPYDQNQPANAPTPSPEERRISYNPNSQQEKEKQEQEETPPNDTPPLRSYSQTESNGNDNGLRSFSRDNLENTDNIIYIGKSGAAISENELRAWRSDEHHAPPSLKDIEIESIESSETSDRELSQLSATETKAKQYENEKAQRFDTALLKSQKETLEAKYWNDFNNCLKYNVNSDCLGQFKPIQNEIEAIDNRIKGREEWLNGVDNMTAVGTLEAEERKYKQLAEMAGLSEYSYKEKEGRPEGWNEVQDSKLSAIISNANDNFSGFHCELLQNGEGKYVVAFRGTEFSAKDIVGADLLESLCPIGQTNNAINVVEELSKAGIALDDITVTGHSLGGRLAAEVAIEKGLTAYTFNAADISITTKAVITTTGFIDPKTNITNTVSANDILTSTVGLGSYLGGNISDKNIIKEAYGNGLGEGHGITFLRQAIEQRYQDIKNKQDRN